MESEIVSKWPMRKWYGGIRKLGNNKSNPFGKVSLKREWGTYKRR